jgi:hypothetical protein
MAAIAWASLVAMGVAHHMEWPDINTTQGKAEALESFTEMYHM